MNTLETQNPNPTLDEIRKYKGQDLDESQHDVLANLAIGTNPVDTFEIGDSVTIVDGQSVGVNGTVQAVEKGELTILPDGKAIK